MAICPRCGGWTLGSKQAKGLKLLEPCQPPNHVGKANWSRVSRGKHPKAERAYRHCLIAGLAPWPDGEDHDEEETKDQHPKPSRWPALSAIAHQQPQPALPLLHPGELDHIGIDEHPTDAQLCIEDTMEDSTSSGNTLAGVGSSTESSHTGRGAREDSTSSGILCTDEGNRATVSTALRESPPRAGGWDRIEVARERKHQHLAPGNEHVATTSSSTPSPALAASSGGSTTSSAWTSSQGHIDALVGRNQAENGDEMQEQPTNSQEATAPAPTLEEGPHCTGGNTAPRVMFTNRFVG